jgi:hypothetical protein
VRIARRSAENARLTVCGAGYATGVHGHLALFAIFGVLATSVALTACGVSDGTEKVAAPVTSTATAAVAGKAAPSTGRPAATTASSTTTTTADGGVFAPDVRDKVLAALDTVRNCQDQPACSSTALDAYGALATQVARTYPSVAPAAASIAKAVGNWKAFGCATAAPTTGCTQLLDAAGLAATDFARAVIVPSKS